MNKEEDLKTAIDYLRASLQFVSSTGLSLDIEKFLSRYPKPLPCKHEAEMVLGNNGLKVSWPSTIPNIDQSVYVSVKCKHCKKPLTVRFEEEK